MPKRNIIINNYNAVTALCNRYLRKGEHCWAAAVLLLHFHKAPFRTKEFHKIKNQLLEINYRKLPSIFDNPRPTYKIMKALNLECVPIENIVNNFDPTDFQFTPDILDILLDKGPLWLTQNTNEGYHDILVHGYHNSRVIFTEFSEYGIARQYLSFTDFNDSLHWDRLDLNKLFFYSKDLIRKMHTPLWYNAAKDQNSILNEEEMKTAEEDAEISLLTLGKRKVIEMREFHTPTSSPTEDASAAQAAAPVRLSIEITNTGYIPNFLNLPPSLPYVLPHRWRDVVLASEPKKIKK